MRRRNPNLKLDRILGLLAHCVRNADSPTEARQGCELATRMLSQHAPDDVVRVLGAAWQQHSGFPGGPQKLRLVWDDVTRGRPEFSARSFDEVADVGSGAGQEADDHGFRRRSERATVTPPPWARHSKFTRRTEPTDRQEEAPPWQTDKKARSHRIDESAGFANKNYCLREIHRKALEDGGPLLLVTFMTFDGEFGRGGLVAYSSESALGFGGKATEAWVGSGPLPYEAKAVFATFAGIPQKALLVRLLGADVADVSDGLWLDYHGDSPWSDRSFEQAAAALVASAEDRLGIVRPERPRRVSGAFYCGECQRKIQVEGGVMPAACGFCDADLRRFKDWPRELERVEASLGRVWGQRQ